MILLVEDNAAHAELVKRSFEDQSPGSEIRHLSDGEAALAYLTRSGAYADPATSPRPDVLLLDLRLPRVGGLEVLEAIRQRPELNGLPVVILSTSAAESDVARAQDLHANGYVVKPSDFTEFVELMGDIGSYWLRWHHYPRQN
jgi:CheY-like chemotaxis protein